ncbi:hypothetical protein [Vibrio alginolyticus]|uniref:hypothetical protein n=1 Tax=Vibrio alginolyticus TaxID=663 RepID=UPI001F5521EF|nr:hypothetical protein [Vibrio alginolyticus]
MTYIAFDRYLYEFDMQSLAQFNWCNSFGRNDAHPAVNDLAGKDTPETKEITSAIRPTEASLAQTQL